MASIGRLNRYKQRIQGYMDESKEIEESIERVKAELGLADDSLMFIAEQNRLKELQENAKHDLPILKGIYKTRNPKIKIPYDQKLSHGKRDPHEMPVLEEAEDEGIEKIGSGTRKKSQNYKEDSFAHFYLWAYHVLSEPNPVDFSTFIHHGIQKYRDPFIPRALKKLSYYES